MRFDVATFTTLSLITFLCSAVVSTALSWMFTRVLAFRFWAAAFFLMTVATACLLAHSVWDTRVLLVATATFGLLARIFVWGGTRVLFGASASWLAGLVVSALFCVLFSLAHYFGAPPLWRAALLVVFFFPVRALTLYEVCRRRRRDLGPARVLVIGASIITTFNAAMPLTFVLLHRDNLSIMLGNSQTASWLYAVVFAADLLLAICLMIMALQLLFVEQGILSNLHKGAAQRSSSSRPATGLARSEMPRSSLPLM